MKYFRTTQWRIFGMLYPLGLFIAFKLIFPITQEWLCTVFQDGQQLINNVFLLICVYTCIHILIMNTSIAGCKFNGFLYTPIWQHFVFHPRLLAKRWSRFTLIMSSLIGGVLFNLCLHTTWNSSSEMKPSFALGMGRWTTQQKVNEQLLVAIFIRWKLIWNPTGSWNFSLGKMTWPLPNQPSPGGSWNPTSFRYRVLILATSLPTWTCQDQILRCVPRMAGSGLAYLAEQGTGIRRTQPQKGQMINWPPLINIPTIG